MKEMLNVFSERLTEKQKNANNKEWYKKIMDSLCDFSFTKYQDFLGNSFSEYENMAINYDLFNNKVNVKDYEKLCKPFGDSIGSLPVDFTNKDIISGKIKALMGMEMRRPYSFKVVATNPEATTRKEQEEAKRIRDFIESNITLPIRKKIELNYQKQTKGRELTPDEIEKIEQQIEQDLVAQTPKEVKRYMQREHQDPAEALTNQILQFLHKKQRIKSKFNEGFKHGMISGKPVFWVGEYNREPVLRVVNPLDFDHDRNPSLKYIEEGQYAVEKLRLSYTEVITLLGEELSEDDIQKLPENFSYRSRNTFNTGPVSFEESTTFDVYHAEWKALKPIYFVRGYNEEVGEYEDIVDENYKINKEYGDIEIEVKWIENKYEGYKIHPDIYAFLREVPGQNRDLNNLNDCKLSYIGLRFDNTNSNSISMVDRMRYYQYLYNVIWYRIELLIASDEGKALFLNINTIPKSQGIGIEKFMHYLKVNKVGFLNPSEEGNKGGSQDVTQIVKEVDMSLVSNINNYLTILEYIEKRCGESVGITKQIEGQIGREEAVKNTQMALVQSANILEPYFDDFNLVKENVLQSLISVAKAVYSKYQPEYLHYVLDDMSVHMIKMDYKIIEEMCINIFISNASKAYEALESVKQLSHAALQNQRAELSDIVAIMNSESTQEVQEFLEFAENQRREQEQANQQQQIKAQSEAQEKERQFKREEWAFEMSKMEKQEKLKTDRELQKQAMFSLGFSEDKDMDNDGTPDILEVYKAGINAEVQQSKLDLERQKLEQKKKEHQDKIALENKKINKMSNKTSTKK